MLIDRTLYAVGCWPATHDGLAGGYVTFQMAEVAVSGRMFGQILAQIIGLRAPPPVPA